MFLQDFGKEVDFSWGTLFLTRLLRLVLNIAYIFNVFFSSSFFSSNLDADIKDNEMLARFHSI